MWKASRPQLLPNIAYHCPYAFLPLQSKFILTTSTQEDTANPASNIMHLPTGFLPLIVLWMDEARYNKKAVFLIYKDIYHFTWSHARDGSSPYACDFPWIKRSKEKRQHVNSHMELLSSQFWWLYSFQKVQTASPWHFWTLFLNRVGPNYGTRTIALASKVKLKRKRPLLTQDDVEAAWRQELHMTNPVSLADHSSKL